LVAVSDPRVGQVRARDDKDQLKPALLVNTHFDSAIGAPGASDAGACVAVMLETLRAMRHQPAPRSPVIFLFNGAEESLQQGSHAFSAHHPWASRVRAVVNMDSAGLRIVHFPCLFPYLFGLVCVDQVVAVRRCLCSQGRRQSRARMLRLHRARMAARSRRTSLPTA
jgi:hypothetical protein